MPELLIIADKDTLYGIEHHYYDDISRAIENGALAVSTIKDYPNKYTLSKHPVGNGMDCYVWNPSANAYLYLLSGDVLSTLINDKSFAIKEALVRMGAKDITLVEQTTDKDHVKTDVHNNFSCQMANADISGNFEGDNVVDIKSEVESHDPNRVAKPYEQVRDFMLTHGLCSDAKLMMLLDRLKQDGELHGTERYTVTYLGEIKSALNIAATIDYKLFNDKLDFSHEHNHVQTISKTLEINFG